MDKQTSMNPGELSEQDAIHIFSGSRVAMVLTNPRLDDNPIIYVNRAFEVLTGYTSSMAVGRNCRFLQGENTKPTRIDRLRNAIADSEDISLTLVNYRSDGSSFLNSLLVSPITDGNSDEPVYFLGLQREAMNDAEADAEDAMNEVITEVQHRVKNHLSMIVGLIRMQARRSGSPEDFNDISRRVESLQLLYEEMSAARAQDNEDRVQLGAYLGRVAAAIAHLDGRTGVRMNVDVAPVVVETDRAVNIGLMVSEILTNAMQHAFKGQKTGLVELRVTETDDGGIRITVSDDGVGLPEDIKWPNESSLGGRIVGRLCETLDGSLNIARGAVGTVFTLEVPNARH